MVKQDKELADLLVRMAAVVGGESNDEEAKEAVKRFNQLAAEMGSGDSVPDHPLPEPDQDRVLKNLGFKTFNDYMNHNFLVLKNVISAIVTANCTAIHQREGLSGGEQAEALVFTLRMTGNILLHQSCEAFIDAGYGINGTMAKMRIAFEVSNKMCNRARPAEHKRCVHGYPAKCQDGCVCPAGCNPAGEEKDEKKDLVDDFTEVSN